jgi:hypothetical protein
LCSVNSTKIPTGVTYALDSKGSSYTAIPKSTSVACGTVTDLTKSYSASLLSTATPSFYNSLPVNNSFSYYPLCSLRTLP